MFSNMLNMISDVASMSNFDRFNKIARFEISI